MKNRSLKIGLIVFLSILLILAIIWIGMGDKRADLARSYLDQGQQLESQEEYKQAYFQYKKAQMATPRSFAPYYHQGILMNKLNQTDKAIEAFSQSIQFARNEMAPTYALAKTYYDNNNYLEAEKYFQRCFAFEPGNSEIFFWLAKCQMNQNRLGEAEKNFRVALEMFPAADYYLYLGLVLAYQDVEDGYEQIEKYTGNQLSFNHLDSQVLAAQSGDADEIEQVFNRMLKTQSEVTRQLLLGQLLNQVGESGLATKKLTKLTEDYQDLRDGWVYLAYGQIQERNFDQAIESLEKARQLDPTYSPTYELLSKTYDLQGNSNTAKEMLIKANMLKEG